MWFRVRSKKKLEQLCESTGGANRAVELAHANLLHCSSLGALKYPHGEPPVVLGVCGVGIVKVVAEDVLEIQPGHVVFCDPMVP